MTARVPLSLGMGALVDDEDVAAVLAAGPWHAHVDEHTTYARKNYRQGGQWASVRLHTFLTGWPLVDHVNGDGLDCRRVNLRPATSAQNAQNRRRRSDNTTGYKGVQWHRQSGRWRAEVYADGRRHYLGGFVTAELAACAYDVAALALHGAFARLNFPAATP